MDIEWYVQGVKALVIFLLKLYPVRSAAMEPPAELSARISAVNAETGMRWDNVHVVNIIPYWSAVVIDFRRYYTS